MILPCYKIFFYIHVQNQTSSIDSIDLRNLVQMTKQRSFFYWFFNTIVQFFIYNHVWNVLLRIHFSSDKTFEIYYLTLFWNHNITDVKIVKFYFNLLSLSNHLVSNFILYLFMNFVMLLSTKNTHSKHH